MATLYVDITAANDTGSAESPYFTELLEASTNAYQQLETAISANSLTSEDTIHIAPGTYAATATIGGTNFRRYFVIYGRVYLDGSSAGDVHSIQTAASGWLYFLKGSEGAIFIIKDYTGQAAGRQVLFGTPGKFDSREVPIAIVNCPNADAMRVYINSSAPNPEHYLTHLILHNVDDGPFCDVSVQTLTATIVNLSTNKVNRPLTLSASQNGATINVCQAFFARTGSRAVFAASSWASVLNIYNAVCVGGTEPHLDVSPITNQSAGSGEVNVFNSHILASPRFGNTTSGTTDSNVTDDETVISNTFMDGSVSFMIDDTRYSDSFAGLMSIADQRGLKVGWAFDLVEDETIATPARWALAKKAASNGHEIYIHSTDEANLGNLFALRIQYTGAGTAASLSISGDTLTTTVDSSQDLSYTLSDYATVTALVTALDAETDYSAETFDRDSTRVGTNLGATSSQYAGNPVTSLFGTVSESDIKTAAVDIEYDEALFFTRQVAYCATAIQDRTGVKPTSLVYPGGRRDPFLDATIESYGASIGRVTQPVSGNERYYPDDIAPMGHTAWPIDDIAPLSDSEAERTRKLIGFFNWVKASGAIVGLYAHNNAEYSQSAWALALDVAVATDVQVKTLKEQSVDVRKGARTNNSGFISYSQDQSEAWIEYALQNNVVDAVKDAAGGVKWWGDGPRPTGVDGEPFPDFDISVGPTQSKAVPFHPANL